jgi:hypothetical protein
MALDLTHYEAVYNNKKGCAITIAEGLVKDIIESGASAGNTIIIEKETINIVKESLESVLTIVNAIMYSNGYYADYTLKKKNQAFIVKHRVVIMTAEEKASLAK